MAQSLQLSNTEILQAIAQVAGFNRSASLWDTNTLTDVRNIIRSGLRRFYTPPIVDGHAHQWRFLERPFYAAGEASYSTGTVTVSGGTVTLAGSTWPSWAADAVIRVGNGTYYVKTVTSTTVLTIDNDAVAAAASSTYTLHRYRYPLPTDFGEFLGGVTYAKGDNTGCILRNVTEVEVRQRYNVNFKTGDPMVYAIVHGDESTATGAADNDDWYLVYWPTADDDASFIGTYRAIPTDNLDNSDLTAGGSTVQIDAVHADTLLAAIQSAAEEFFDNRQGPYFQRFMMRLQASVKHDQTSKGPVSVYGNDKIDRRALSLLFHTPTYNDLI